MKLWKLSQTVNNDYDTYDSAVVAAYSEEEARTIHPSAYYKWGEYYSGWALEPSQVMVEYLGQAKEGTTSGVVLASFNAG